MTRPKVKVVIELTGDALAYLALLDPEGSAEVALEHLAYSAADGIMRPAAWEHDWICCAFPEDEFLSRVGAKIEEGQLQVNTYGQLIWTEEGNDAP
jgi:hypothetical protein